jgi:AP-4 complex subunit mu-1
MNYRLTSDFNAPFKLFTFFQTVSQYKIEMTIKLKSTYPKTFTGSLVVVRFKVPSKASGITPEIVQGSPTQKSEFNEEKNMVEWIIKEMPGDTEYTLLVKITIPQASSLNVQRETGPISLNF